MKSMEGYVERFAMLVRVEQQLLNAAGEIQMAQIRLTEESPLRDELRRLHRVIDDAVSHTRETKRVLLAKWRAAETGLIAA